METVFEPDNNIEGHMIVNLLERSGVESELIGQHLQGGVGGLPPAGNIRVVVFDAGQVEEARKIIKEWEKTPHADESVTPRSGSSGLPSFLFGILVGMGVASAFLLWLFNYSTEVQRVDYDGDGTVDEYFYYDGRVIDRIEADRNGDGKIDGRHYFSVDSGIDSSELDNDFNGSFEVKHEFKHSKIEVEFIDLAGGGAPDHLYYFVNGVVDHADFRDPRTGSIRRTETHENGLLKEARWDSDDDGVLDTLIKYGFFGEELSHTPLTGE